MKVLSLFILITFFISCSNQAGKNTSSLTDSIQIAQHIKDSLHYIQDSLDDVGPTAAEYKKFLQDYIDSYNKVDAIDTLFKDESGKIVKVHSRFYCLFDSGVILPGKYNWADTNRTFITHNFADDIRIIIDKDTIYNKTISKNDFADSLSKEEFKCYAIYRLPGQGVSFNGYDATQRLFTFLFPIGIPETDVVFFARVMIDKKGNKSFSLR